MTTTPTRQLATDAIRREQLKAEDAYYMAHRTGGAWGECHFSGLGLADDWGITNGYNAWKV